MRTDLKARRAGTNEEPIRRIQDHGITVNGCFILGLDGHTPKVSEEMYDFAHWMPLYEVQITVLKPFPGTPLCERLLRAGLHELSRPL